jgi:hypothetical protein
MEGDGFYGNWKVKDAETRHYKTTEQKTEFRNIK